MESLAHTIYILRPCVGQIVEAMNQDSGVGLTQLQVDGGMTANQLLMQLQADILHIPVGEDTPPCSTHNHLLLQVLLLADLSITSV